MSSFDPSSPSPSKSRRRLAAWAAFGVVGLATGAVWASGFAQNTGVNDATAISPALGQGRADRRRVPAGRTRHRGRRPPVRLGGPLGHALRRPPDVHGRPDRRRVHRQDLQRRAAAGQHVRPHRVRLAAARARDHRRGQRGHARRLLHGRLRRYQRRADPRLRRRGLGRLLERARRQHEVLHRYRLDDGRRLRRHVHPRPRRTRPRRSGRSSSPRSSAPPSTELAPPGGAGSHPPLRRAAMYLSALLADPSAPALPRAPAAEPHGHAEDGGEPGTRPRETRGARRRGSVGAGSPSPR